MSHLSPTTPSQQSPPGRPATVARTIILAAVALSGSAALTYYLTTRAPEQFPGELQADAMDLTAPVDGTVDLVSVDAGEIVYPDEQLFLIRSSEHELHIASAQTEIERLQSELRKKEAGYKLELAQILHDMDSAIFGIRNDMAQLEGERFHLKFQDTAFSDVLGVLSEPLASADSTDLMRLLQEAPDPAMRLRAMIERGRIENELDTKQVRIGLCESRLSQLKSGQKELPETLRAALGLPEVEARLASSRQHLSEMRNLDVSRFVSAPAYGMAGLVQVATGDTVTQGQTLLQVFDRSRESVQVEFPSRLTPRLSVDQEVSLMFPGDELRTGRIESVPPQVTRPPRASDESKIEVTIRPVGRVWPTLPIGTTVSVSLRPAS